MIIWMLHTMGVSPAWNLGINILLIVFALLVLALILKGDIE